MTKKTFKRIDKKGHEETWEWDETPEVVAALKYNSITVDSNLLLLVLLTFESFRGILYR